MDIFPLQQACCTF